MGSFDVTAAFEMACIHLTQYFDMSGESVPVWAKVSHRAAARDHLVFVIGHWF